MTVPSSSQTTMLYRRAVLQAVAELQDWNHRSSIDAIRKHVRSSFTDGDNGERHAHRPSWNEVVFFKTLQTLVRSGELVEHIPHGHRHSLYEFSEEWKRKRIDELLNTMLLPQHSTDPPSPPSATSSVSSHDLSPGSKELPKRKTEHTKIKIVPKKIYDRQHVLNPMDTHE